MPVGWEAGASVGGWANTQTQTPLDSVREAGRWVAERTIEQVPRWELVQQGRDVWEWVLETIAERYPVAWFGWEVHPDERLCPECAIYAGDTWEADTWHPAPPLHVNCRCREYLHHVEWRTRYVETWRLQLRRQTWWEWDITSWDTIERTEWTWQQS